ncbi:MAG TPA: Uma2 family endonuclease [Longimicrobium sp.]|jgi:Uma2 family endonuclease|uniref:Uma2 family endonuclease n=1 Tax=Longimicrobium sp. TaxID=2029185 RepID=UPI002EDB3300
MATHPQTAKVTLQDFLAAAEAAEGHLEFIDGQIVAMGGATITHGRITQRIAYALSAQLEGSSCEVLSQGNLVASGVAENAFVPDVVVFCGEPRFLQTAGGELLLNPVVLVEVLSPSTAHIDHDVKLDNYRRIATLQEYLIVSQDRPRVERYMRQNEHFWQWSVTEGLNTQIRLDGLQATLDLARIYAGLGLKSEDE